METAFKKIHPHLPLFRISGNGKAIFYVPGKLLVLNPKEADILEEVLRAGVSREDEGQFHPNIIALLARAREAGKQWAALGEKPFSPECLTVYPSNDCNLDCRYCYTRKSATEGEGGNGVIDLQIVRAAARRVAGNCRKKGATFALVVHGGGEPTYHWSFLQQLYQTVRQIAADADVPFFSYIATNGIIKPAQARWLAAHFDVIGLSCDGPPDIQDRQRPTHNRRRTSEILAQAAAAIRQAGGHLEVRATVLPGTVHRLPESVAYFMRELGAARIRIEPVYGDRAPVFMPVEAGWFVEHFLEAQQAALNAGCEVTISGVRLPEVHGPYCDVLRDTLRLTPGGTATSCFYEVDGDAAHIAENAIGRYDAPTGRFRIDAGKVAAARAKALALPEACRDCINIYHCARGCPDYCPLAADSSVAGGREHLNRFRCQMQVQLTLRWIARLAEQVG